MIKLGFDGLSRGDFDSGIMLGVDIRTLVPLGTPAVDFEENQILEWLKSWMGIDFSPPLSVKNWYCKGHEAGVHVWAPPPAGALIALEELAQSKLKHPFEVTHVFVCPRLLYYEEWSRRLGNLNVSTSWWNWRSECKKCLKPDLTWEKGIFCANFGATRGGFSDCKSAWCGECFVPHPLDPKIVAEPIDFDGRPLTVPDDKNRFMSARNGDHTLTPFQCPLCQCRNIKRRNLIPNLTQDELFVCQ
eukprot:scaffold132204_cov35-Cyclotella_meneghiniana.AAC.2